VAKLYGGRWRVVESADEGGQAHIFRVEDTKGEFPGYHALKRLKDVGRLDRFEREVEVTSGLNHPNILKVEDFDVTGKPPYYVSEWCEGRSLEDSPQEFAGDITGTVELLLPIVDALQAAALLIPPVVHRDVKPANILLRTDGTPVLADFGICHVADGKLVTLSDRAMGSTNYVAPEMQAGQHGVVTSGADVYSLGKTLYWMLSGGHIFAREAHRAPGVYLVERLGAQRWEHVHSILDGMIVEDYTKRHNLALLASLLQSVTYLVSGDFVPLRPSIGLLCRWCGRGTYKTMKTLDHQGHIAWLYTSGLRGLKCSHCGRIEFFDITGIENPEWLKR
jgi:serine/threonine protein kinase